MPQFESEAKGINEKAKNLSEYMKAYGGAPGHETKSPQAPKAPREKLTPPNPKNQYGTRKGEKRIDTSQMLKPLGSFKKGGKVKKTGLYKLHKGERVNPVKKAKKKVGKAGCCQKLGMSPPGKKTGLKPGKKKRQYGKR